jgi:soluble lytic murein transglycosylase-like protein
VYEEVEQKYGLPKGIVGAVASVETGGLKDPDRAVSRSGAIGRMQLIPKTAKELGVNPYDPAQNLDGGARYLKYLFDYFNGDQHKAVTAYNWGMGKVRKAEINAKLTGDDWTKFINNKESREYAGKVFANLGVNEIDKTAKAQSFSIGAEKTSAPVEISNGTNDFIDHGGVKLAQNTVFENIMSRA